MALVAAFSDWDAPTTSAEGARRYSDLTQALGVAGAYLYPRDIGSAEYTGKPIETPDVSRAFEYLREVGREDEVFLHFMDEVEDRFFLVKRDISRYMNALQETSAVSVVPQTESTMVEFLDRLAAWQRAWGVPVRAFNDSKLIIQFTNLFSLLLHSSFHPTFPSHFGTFLRCSLSRLPTHLLDPPPHPHLLQSVPVNYEKVAPPSAHLSRLAMVPRYSATLSKVAYGEIERIAREEAEKGWDVRRLTRARQRVGDGVANWLSGMFEGNESAQHALRPMFSRFDYYLCKCLFDIRTDELFDIIVDYPDSLAALEDLKECLFKVDQRSVLVDKLKAANIKRLLHPGAETKDVITQYISTIRCLRILDPPGVLLHKVAEPVRRHLRDRPDTIKCIVAALVEGEELSDENEASAGLIAQSNDETAENFTDPKWDPEPIDAAPEFRSGKASDIISTLVSIYESREVIIKELQNLLATRLLAVKDYDAVKEIRTIELLKIRFGEAAMQVCDVMLKDMADSKRIDDHVHGDIKSTVHPLIISRMFWPNIQSSSLRLPPMLEAVQRQYELAFHHFKPDKRLRWLQHIGTAQVKLELADRIVEAEATPLQASVAELFEGQDVWTVQALGEMLRMRDTRSLRNALVFWAALGVLKEVKEGWRLLEHVEEGTAVQPGFAEETPVIQEASDDQAAQVRVHWNYIKGVLTNLGPRRTEFIQNMLGYVDDYEQKVEELEAFLHAARREGLVDQKPDGSWALLEV